jgi:hypothetical protein
VAGLVLAVAVAAALWLAAGPPRPPAGPGGPPRARPSRRPSPVAAPAVLPDRNVFEYADAPAAVAPAAARPAALPGAAPEDTATPPPVPPEPVRLVGLVHRGGTLRAVLSVLGEVAVVGPGEEVQGYRVLAVDEERVRLRWPDGTERTLARPDGP